LRKIGHLLPQALLSKSEVCKHEHSCFENTIRKALKNFLVGFFIQFMLKNIMLLAKPAKMIRNLRKISTLLDCTRFGLFLMCFNTAYKFILCLLRRLGSLDDQVNAPAAGFVSALFLAIDSNSRRQLITVLAMSRAIEASLCIGETSGTIPRVPYRDLILWIISNCFLQSAMGFK